MQTKTQKVKVNKPMILTLRSTIRGIKNMLTATVRANALAKLVEITAKGDSLFNAENFLGNTSAATARMAKILRIPNVVMEPSIGHIRSLRQMI